MKSYIDSFSRYSFHILVDMSMKVQDEFCERRRVSFRSDLSKSVYSDIGVLNFNILYVPTVLCYLYKLCTVRISFAVNNGLVLSFL